MGENLKNNWRVFRVMTAGEWNSAGRKNNFFLKSGYCHSWSSSAHISNASFRNWKPPHIFAFLVLARFAPHNCRQDVTAFKPHFKSNLSCNLNFCPFKVALAARGRANIKKRKYHFQSCSEPFVTESDTPTVTDLAHEVITELQGTWIFFTLLPNSLTWLPLKAVMKPWLTAASNAISNAGRIFCLQQKVSWKKLFWHFTEQNRLLISKSIPFSMKYK